MKKILLFTHNFLPIIGGAEIVVYNLASKLSTDGYDVLVLCGGKKKDNAKIPSHFKINFKISRYPYKLFKGSGKIGLHSLFSFWYLFYFVLIGKYTIVHSHFTYHPGYVSALLKKFLPIKYILTPHGEDIQIDNTINYGITRNRLTHKQVSFALHSANYATAISLSIKKDMIERFQTDENQIKLIPNGLDLERFKYKENPKDIRSYFNLPQSSKILLSVGREQIYKNYKYGIKAFEILKEINVDIFNQTHYIIIGKDVIKHQDYINRHNLGSHIHLLETLPQEYLVDCYQTSDIFLQTSIIESFGLVSIEAFSCGLPVIATDVPGNNDVVNDKVGFCVNLNNPKAMSEKIKYLLTNKSVLNQLSKNGVIEAQQYNWNAVIQQYKKLYDNLEE